MTIGYAISGPGTARACNCIGPQNGEPLCPCAMRGVVKRNDRWIRVEHDLGPVVGHGTPLAPTNHGCICPAGAEKTCRGAMCPRKAPPSVTGKVGV